MNAHTHTHTHTQTHTHIHTRTCTHIIHNIPHYYVNHSILGTGAANGNPSILIIVSSSSSKPGINDGLLKEDEDAVRRSLLQLEADHARMKQTLEETIRDAEVSVYICACMCAFFVCVFLFVFVCLCVCLGIYMGMSH